MQLLQTSSSQAPVAPVFFHRPTTLNRSMRDAGVLKAAAAKVQAITPYATRSQVSTLKRPKKAKEVGVNMKEGALFFYSVTPNKNFKPEIAWLSFAAQVAYPDMEQRVLDGKLKRKYRSNIDKFSEAWTQAGISATASVRKESDHFLVTIPVAFVPSQGWGILREIYSARDANEQSLPPGQMALTGAEQGSPVNEVTFDPSQLKQRNGMFPAVFLDKLKNLHGASVTVRRMASGDVVFLSLPFTVKECEYLTLTNWLEIRPVDMYGLARAWSETRMGKYGRPLKFMQSLPSIAADVPKDVPPKVSAEGVLIDEQSQYMWVPPRANTIGSYEAGLIEAFSQPDGTFCAVDLNTGSLRRAPASRVVYVDWANLKLAYSDSKGKLHVKNLDRSKPASSSHYRRLFDYSLIETVTLARSIKVAIDVAKRLGVPNIPSELIGPSDEVAPLALAREVVQAMNKREAENTDADPSENPTPDYVDSTLLNFVKLIDVFAHRDASPVLQGFVSVMSAITTAMEIEDNMGLVANDVDVISVLRAVGLARVFSMKAASYYEILLEDNSAREAYRRQDAKNPDYVPRDVPFMAKDKDGNPRAMLPHQARVSSKLDKSPDFAILPVHAGGGKTMLAVYDVLKEIGDGTSHRFLIMCPSHLVGQYVKEFVYFTHGRINVLAVNAYTMRRHGVEGLAVMLQNAPLNTIVVTDYNIAMGASRSIPTGYGTAAERIYPVVEMLRSFNFDYVFMDESHMLKGTTNRTASVSRLVTNIKKKRLASGTITPDNIVDIVQQVSLLDPSILGNRIDFIEKYAMETRGNRITKWKQGARESIMAEIKGRCVWAPAKRKEWAALLPDLQEIGHKVEMTSSQQVVYKSILEQVIEELQLEMENSKKLRKLFKELENEGADAEAADGDGDGDGDSDEEEDEEDDTDLESGLERLLKPYLARLEMYVTAPALDELGNKVLVGQDRVSPKVIKIAEICDQHIRTNTPGKILIFCNYHNSAQAIYDGLPADLQEKTILYSAGKKAECGAQFETDSNKLIMVGVETSMNTGLNLQFCSRLIRADSVWTPGALEQGNSRVQRPNIKQKETRSKVFIDWVIANRSIDVTKMAYLFAKRISVGKFEEAGNPLYENVGDPPLFKMTFNQIAESNEQDAGMLAPYFQSYKEFKEAQLMDFAQYRAEHPEDTNPDGSIRMVPLKRASNPAGCALMYRLPYVPGTEIYNSDDLGLVRYDQLLMLEESALLSEEDGGAADTDSQTQREINRAELARVAHLSVHCEYGDCQIVAVNKRGLRVRDALGVTHMVSKLTAFVITRAQTNAEDMRTAVLKEIGDIPFDSPVKSTVSAKDRKLPKNAPPVQKEAPVDNTIRVNLEIVVMNDFVGIEFTDVESNPRGARALESIGFKQPPPYSFAEITNPQQMYRQFEKWHETGFVIAKGYNEPCRDLFVALKKARANAVNFVGLASSANLANFMRQHIKPVSDPTLLCPFPMIHNNKIYLCLPTQGHPASSAAMKIRAPGIKWSRADHGGTLSVYMPSLSALDRNMRSLLEVEGLEVTNLEALKTRRKNLERRNPGLFKGLQK